MRILSMIPNEMFSYTWNNPPHLSTIRDQRTVVNISFKRYDGKTEITFIHSGFAESGEWLDSSNYFLSAWGEIVLPRLKYVIENLHETRIVFPERLTKIEGKIYTI